MRRSWNTIIIPLAIFCLSIGYDKNTASSLQEHSKNNLLCICCVPVLLLFGTCHSLSLVYPWSNVGRASRLMLLRRFCNRNRKGENGSSPFLHEVFSLVAIVKCKSGLRVGLNQVNDENSKLSYLMLGQKATGENSRINAGSGYSCFLYPGQ